MVEIFRPDASYWTEETSPVYEESERIQTLSLEYIDIMKTQVSEFSTIATSVPNTYDITSSFFEHDITGSRVKNIGQSTGGFVSEVMENEGALSYALQDATCIYIIKKIADNEGYYELSEMNELIANSEGWWKFSLLYKANLIEVTGFRVRLTQRGYTELNYIMSYAENLIA